MARKVDTVGLWYHPQVGAQISRDKPLYTARYTGFPYTAWERVATLELAPSTSGRFVLAPGQRLPAGYLLGDTSKQHYGWGGGFLVYAPIHRRCYACSELFELPAKAQKHLYETLGVFVDKQATRCQPCARTRRAIEDARAAYSAALAALAAHPTGAAHAKVARSMLDLLEAGGQVSLPKAIGHCTRARKLGAASAVAATEAKLRARA